MGTVFLPQLSTELQVGLDQVILQQKLQGLGQTCRGIAVYFAYVLKGVG